MTPRLPVGEAVEAAVAWLLEHVGPVFAALAWAVDGLTRDVEAALLAAPPGPAAAVLALVALARVGPGFGAFTGLALAVVAGMDLWPETMRTLALVLSSTLLALGVGLPLGVLAAKRAAVDGPLRPLLDFMQTMPAFVHLIPAVMFFGLGRVPGAVATVIFAMPPAVRLTRLGLRQVPADLVEAGVAFGCTPRQLLWKVELPVALPSIMAGVNQTMMLALSMVVIAAMIGAGGLGNPVLRGIQRLDVGLGFESGIAVVLLAIVLDRITQSFGQRQRPGRWRRRLVRLLERRKAAAEAA